ncbi:NfeD family protein [Ramlibacter sp. H39-3-26]|uniref:NfeD family protein n=1 Tax=Curvibacter soli TaxID=3031331 RepID=UPI0023DADBDD|nr:NfeD family protein [Ramlibacter sp. H39-3-26]MDF1486579.1 NfeD family protein [Ramlibacter sp. H39-3-26]
MAYSTLWWLATGSAVVAELLTGTFYLLMIAAGLAAGAIAAHAGLPPPAQIVASALVGGGAVLLCYYGKRRKGTGRTNARLDAGLDVGEHVQVDAWAPDATAQVRYRGTLWTAILRPGASAQPGLHRIVEVVGSRLLLDRM